MVPEPHILQADSWHSHRRTCHVDPYRTPHFTRTVVSQRYTIFNSRSKFHNVSVKSVFLVRSWSKRIGSSFLVGLAEKSCASP